MSSDVLFIGGLFSVIFYLISVAYIGNRMDDKRAEVNLLTILTPVIIKPVTKQ